MVITRQILDELSEQARNSARLRMNYDLRNSLKDRSQRMLNAIEIGTVIPIHRHLSSSETVAVLRGKVRWCFYDGLDENKMEPTESVLLDANGEARCLNVEKGRWHSLEVLEPGSVILEAKDGAYEPLSLEEIFEQ